MGTGFNIPPAVSDADTPTWCLQEEFEMLSGLNANGTLSTGDQHRLVELKTLLDIRSQMES